MKKIWWLFFIGSLMLLAIFSYGFVDANFPFSPLPLLYSLVHQQHLLATVIYIVTVVWLFGVYGCVLRQVKKGRIDLRQVWWLIFITVAVLFFAFPAFSYDIFNYMATAKVIFFYKENPYLVMPIEFVGEPMLKFMHAANKTALYGPVWILLTAIPHFLGQGNILLTVFTFKALVVAFYLGLVWLIWKLTKSSYALVFFALNPLVVIETLVSAHNDVVMMFFAFLALWLLFQKKKLLSFVFLLLSMGIKYATVILTPLLLTFAWLKKPKNKQRFIFWSVLAMYFVFLIISPLREEIYSWYFIWILSLTALIVNQNLLFWLSLAFSFGLLFRFAPFLATGSWGGLTPLIKILVTFIPPGLTLLWLGLKVVLDSFQTEWWR